MFLIYLLSRYLLFVSPIKYILRHNIKNKIISFVSTRTIVSKFFRGETTFAWSASNVLLYILQYAQCTARGGVEPVSRECWCTLTVRGVRTDAASAVYQRCSCHHRCVILLYRCTYSSFKQNQCRDQRRQSPQTLRFSYCYNSVNTILCQIPMSNIIS